jgi:hypothetical protein
MKELVACPHEELVRKFLAINRHYTIHFCELNA